VKWRKWRSGWQWNIDMTEQVLKFDQMTCFAECCIAFTLLSTMIVVFC
jgi:hypothetical protein